MAARAWAVLKAAILEARWDWPGKPPYAARNITSELLKNCDLGWTEDKRRKG